MCAWFGVLFGRRNRIFCACRHLGGGGALLRNLSDKNALSSASNTTEKLSAEEQEKALHDAGVLSGNLDLDPEHDPVVWVTDNGFEIKSHDVAVSSGTTTVSTVSYKYITLGSWNWIIIGYSTKDVTQGTGHVSVATPDNYDRNTYTTWLDGATPKLVPDSTDAGNAIKSAVQTQSTNFYNTSSFTYKLKSVFTNALGTTEIDAGCVLCLCASITGASRYDYTSPYEAKFPSSDLDTAMTDVYNSIKTAANNQIQEIELTTYWYNGSAATKYTHSEYLFPLACSTFWSDYSQNYCVETYLNSNAKRDIRANWWLRSGHSSISNHACYVDYARDLATWNINSPYGVRPAFVLKIT